MSAWYVCSMMGFYPVCPASGQYVITSPGFDEIRIQLPESKYFTIRSTDRSDKNIYIRSAEINGKKLKSNYLIHKEIMEGGTVEFRLRGNSE
jgi:putative alpha-1,2-mannosidase